MNYFLQGFGVFLGVIAGVVVTLIASTIIDKRRNKKNAQNLLFEFELNIKKIDLWLEEIEKYRKFLDSILDQKRVRSFFFNIFKKVSIIVRNKVLI